MKRTPIYAIAEHSDATFVQMDGWWVVDAFNGEGEALAQGALQLGLGDRSARTKVLVEGTSAAAVVERAWGVRQLAIHSGATLERGAVYRLRHDRYFLSGPPGSQKSTVSTTEAAVRQEDSLVAVTDVTHGRAELWLLGRLAPDLLSRLCGLDLHGQQFPDLTARETSVAKTTQMVIRRDAGPYPVYALIGARSLGAYLWQTLVEAAHDLPLQLCGERLLRALQNKEPDAAS